MKFSVCLISLIAIYILPTIYSQSAKPVPGCSGCGYFASTEDTCGAPSVPVSDLPRECSSFFYSDIVVNNGSNMSYGYPDIDNEYYIQSLLDSNKSTFLYYGYSSPQEWIDAVKNNAEIAKTDMENLKTFLEPYQNIAGLVIEAITPLPETTDFDGFTENVQAYIDEMKKCFPDFSIGFEIFGKNLIDFKDQDSPPSWLDFSVLDSCIDFYIVNVYKLNDCSEEFKVGGSIPLTGTAFYTVDILNGFLVQAGIPQKKVHFMFRTGPRRIDQNLTVCDSTSTLLCGQSSFDGFCADNTQSYYDKGKYAKDNGAGFIALDLDLTDDPFNCCHCAGPYPAFYAMLAGSNGSEVPPNCPLFDKS